MTSPNYTYARFWKCALQVNPHSYSSDYRGQNHGLDSDAYTNELIRYCLAEEVQVVGIADHGSVKHIDHLRKAISAQDIVVFPGFEISSTEKVHMVCLFQEDTTTEELQRVLGKLNLLNPQERVVPSSLGCLDIARIVQDQGGFWYAAHMTGSRGLLRLQKDGGGLVHVWKNHDLVKVGQIPEGLDSLESNYKTIVQNKDANYKRDRPIVVINAKDIATPSDLADPRALTHIKMTRPCFESFLTAFKDPDSRVRLSDQVTEKFYSQIKSVRIEGGYFDGLNAKLSGHLDAVIGGRGTGKSTLLECLRYALDLRHKAPEAAKQGDQIVSENLGKEGGRVIVELTSAANNMKCYTIIRRFGEPPRVIDEDENESTLHPGSDLLPQAEFYGQNEIYELAQNPEQLARILDRFLPEDTRQAARLEILRKRLQENSARLIKAIERKNEIASHIAELPKLQERIVQFKEQGLEEKLKVVPLLEKEKVLEPRLKEEIQRVRAALDRFTEDLPDIVFLSDGGLEGLPHREVFVDGRLILENLVKSLGQKLEEIASLIERAETALKPITEKLQAAMTQASLELENEFAALPSMVGKSGRQVGVAYQRLLGQIEEIKPMQSHLTTAEALVIELEQTRRNLIGEISDSQSERLASKQQAAKRLNRRLQDKLRITIVPNGLRQPLHEILQTLPGVGAQKTRWIDSAQDLTTLGFVAAIRQGKQALLDKNWGITSGFADTLTRLSPSLLYSLETTDLEERVNLELNVAHSGPARFRALNQLSTGQQCTAILHLLLLENSDPLILDQPEDNLDNAFIAERIVKELRIAKTERQFVFATHNANIPVFGDAEWIGVCSATGERATMSPDMQGSIDLPEIRDQAAAILEGGKEAFTQRREKYGFGY